MTPEGQIQAAILDYLALIGVWAIRVNSGARVIEGERRYFFRGAPKGTADIIGCLPGGRLLCVEVKTAKGKVSPEQSEFLAARAGEGALCLVARSVEDVEQALRSAGVIR